MAPVAQRIEVAHVETGVEALIDARQAAGDLAAYEGFAAARGSVVDQDAVAGIHAVGLAVVHRDPVGIELGDAIGAAGIEGRGFFLRRFLHQAVKLTGAGLVDAGFVCEHQHAHRFQDAQGAKGVGIGGVFQSLKAHRRMALADKVVNLIWMHR